MEKEINWNEISIEDREKAARDFLTNNAKSIGSDIDKFTNKGMIANGAGLIAISQYLASSGNDSGFLIYISALVFLVGITASGLIIFFDFIYRIIGVLGFCNELNCLHVIPDYMYKIKKYFHINDGDTEVNDKKINVLSDKIITIMSVLSCISIIGFFIGLWIGFIGVVI